MELKKLSDPFPAERISWRVGATNKEKTSGLALAYIDARDVMERLDEIVGLGKYQVLHPHANGKTSCRIGIKIDNEWVWKENGAGDSEAEAEKGAFSDSFKRAAVLWGVGRYLYDMPKVWVEIEPHGKSYRIKDNQILKLNKTYNDFIGGKKDGPKETPIFENSAKRKEWVAKAADNVRELKTSEAILDWETENDKFIEALGEQQKGWLEDIISKQRTAIRPQGAVQ